MNCSNCSKEGVPADILRVRGYDLARCGTCHVRRVDPLPSEESLLDEYTERYFEEGGQGYPGYLRDEAAHRGIAVGRLGRLQRFIQGGRLLDVGCAAGFFLDEATLSGFEPWGVDPCPEMVEIARERFSINAFEGGILTLQAEPASFDAITFYQVIAHVRDPGAVLRRAWALLKPGGILAIETWDAESPVARLMGRHWPLLSPPTVLYYLGRRSLPSLLERHGFDVLDRHCGGKSISLTHGLSVLEDKYPKASPLIRMGHGRAAQAIRVPFGLGQLLSVVARK